MFKLFMMLLLYFADKEVDYQENIQQKASCKNRNFCSTIK
jgi:hypothetical protein